MHDSQQQDGRIVETIDVICPSDRKVGGGRGKRQEPVPVKRVALANGLDVFHTPPELYVLHSEHCCFGCVNGWLSDGAIL